MRCLSQESGPAQMEDFLIEGISPSKMASIKSVLSTLNVKLSNTIRMEFSQPKTMVAQWKRCIPKGRTKLLPKPLASFSFLSPLVSSRLFQFL